MIRSLDCCIILMLLEYDYIIVLSDVLLEYIVYRDGENQ